MLVVLNIIIITWQFSGERSINVKLFVSTPIIIFDYVLDNYPLVENSFIRTGTEALVGIIVSASISILLTLVFFLWPKLLTIVYPWIVVSQVVPFVVLAPLTIVIFGEESIAGKISLSTIITFFPIMGNLVTALKNIPHEELEVMTILDANKLNILRHTIIPNSLTYFYSGLKIAAPISVIGAVLAEFSGADIGIGKDIFTAGNKLEADKQITGIINSMLLASIIYFLVVLVESRHGKWYRGVKNND